MPNGSPSPAAVLGAVAKQWPLGAAITAAFFFGAAWQDYRDHEDLGGHPKMEARMAKVEAVLPAVLHRLQLLEKACYSRGDRPTILQRPSVPAYPTRVINKTERD